MRKWGFLSLLCMVGICHVAAARAEDALVPAREWTVGVIHSKARSDTGYCSMKTTYSDGREIVFARDYAGANSIAFDFGKKTLVAGSQYNVVLTLSPLLREEVAVAATSSVLIVQLGDDQPFYATLLKKNKMRLAVSGKEDIFLLNGAAEALPSLEKCANSLSSRVAFKGMKVSAPYVPQVEPTLTSPAAPVLGEAPPSMPAERKPGVEVEALGVGNEDTSRQMQAMQAEIERLRAENAKLAAGKGVPEDKETAMLAPVAVEAAVLEPSAGDGAAPIADPLSWIKSVLAGEKPKQSILTDLGKPQGFKWQWSVQGLTGEMREMDKHDTHDMPSVAESYIKEISKECKGDFAAQRHDKTDTEGYSLMEVETACMQAANSSTSALLFVAGKSAVYSIRQMAGLESAQKALDSRDEIIEAISGGVQKTAAK